MLSHGVDSFFCSQAFSEDMANILLLAEILLRSNEASVSNFGCNIYKQAFVHFDTYCRQVRESFRGRKTSEYFTCRNNFMEKAESNLI